MIKKLVKNNKKLFSLALSFKEFNFKQDCSKLNDSELNLFKQLNENGVAVIPNYFNEEECALLRKEYDKLVENHSVEYGNDKRIFGIEKLSEEFNRLFNSNKMFKKVGEAYIGDELLLQTTMAAKIIPNEKEIYGSGGSWHRDSFSKQYKAIAYLDDVTIDNGPFMYINGSQKMDNIKKVINKLNNHIPGNYRYTNEEIERCSKILGKEITYYTAPKGTLVLADIRGLHTGMPIKKGHRYAVFNYYIAKSHYQESNEVEKLAKY